MNIGKQLYIPQQMDLGQQVSGSIFSLEKLSGHLAASGSVDARIGGAMSAKQCLHMQLGDILRQITRR